jgi:hypothetical protein
MTGGIMKFTDEPFFQCRYIWNKHFVGYPIQSIIGVKCDSGEKDRAIKQCILQILIADIFD